MDAPETLGPYQLLEPLGRGGMGVVYRAFRADTGQVVALKTVRVAGARQIHSIRREIFSLSRIRHPGIVRILDHGVVEGVPWYAMELLEGDSLRSRADAVSAAIGPSRSSSAPIDTAVGDTVPMSIADDPMDDIVEPPLPARPRAADGRLLEVLTLVRRLCDPLAFLHGEGIVHRDLKPENVFVVDGGRPVLVDFGLASRTPHRGREQLWLDGVLHGTVSYMSPEQLRGEPLDARTDLYSLGIILYELVTGRLPFRGGTPGSTATMHLSRLPLPPSERVADLPPGLEELILKLLAKRPADRVGHADDVARRLEGLGAAAPRWDVPRPRAYLYRPRVVGRAAELERIERHLHAGVEPILLIGGEPGTGKTRIALEVAQTASNAGWMVIGGSCTPGEVGGAEPPGPALHPLRDALEAVADRCRDGGPVVTERILGDRAPLLAPYAPDLFERPEDPTRPEPPTLPPEAARNRALTALTATLEALAQDTSLVLLLDDLQWADDLTLQWLDGLRRLDGTPLRILATYRLGEGPERLRALCSAAGVAHVSIGRLPPEAIARMVSDMLAVPAPSQALVEFLVRRSEGIPFFVAEYLRAAVADGLLRRDRNGRWGIEGGRGEAYEALPLPTSLRLLVRRRIDGLEPAAAALLDLAAVLGRDLDPAQLDSLGGAATTQRDDAERLEALGELVQRRILAESEAGRLRFVHHTIVEVAYARIPPERRRALHEQVALALASRSDPLGELGHHWERAGRPALARSAYLDAARGAARRHDLAHARRLYESALAQVQGPSPEGVAARVALARDILRPLGALAEALEHLGAAIQEARHLGDLHLQGATLEEQGRVTRQIGRLDDAARLFRHALAIARGVGDLSAQGRLLCALAGGLPPPAAARCYDDAVHLADAAHDSPLAARALLGRGRVRQDRGEAAAAERDLRDALDAYRGLRDRRGEADALTALADTVARTAPQDALAIYREALTTYREIGDRLRVAVVRASLGTALHQAGRTGESHAAYGEALQEFRELGHHRFQGHALHRIGLHLRREGRLAEARGAQEQALVLLEVVGDRSWASRARRELAEVSLRQGRPADAERFAARAAELARAAGEHALEADALATRARASARAGDLVSARRWAAEALEAAHATADDRTEATTWAQLARVLGPEDAVPALERAQHTLQAEGRHEEAARALVELGHLALAGGRNPMPWLLAAREAHLSSVYLDPEVAEQLRELESVTPAPGPERR